MTRETLTEIAGQFSYWVKNRSERWGAPIVEPPSGEGDESRPDRLLDAYFQNAKPNQVVAILKAREPARILVAIGDKDNDSPHLEYKQRNPSVSGTGLKISLDISRQVLYSTRGVRSRADERARPVATELCRP